MGPPPALIAYNMPGGALPQTPQQRALRLKGYELHLSGAIAGKRTSDRSIAMVLGVTSGTIANWRRRDKWDERVKKAVDQRTTMVQHSTGTVTTLLRTSLYKHIETLNSLISDPSTRERDRILAIKEFVSICKTLNVLVDVEEATPPIDTPDFNDELPGEIPGTLPEYGEGVLPDVQSPPVEDLPPPES